MRARERYDNNQGDEYNFACGSCITTSKITIASFECAYSVLTVKHASRGEYNC